MRGLVVALVGEPVRGTPNVVRIEGATDGIVFVYDVLGVENIPRNRNIQVFSGPTARRDAVQAYPWLRAWLIHVVVTTGNPLEPTRICQPGAMKAGETIQVRDAQGVQRTRTRAARAAGDRPLWNAEAWPVHEWAGRPNDLGDDE